MDFFFANNQVWTAKHCSQTENIATCNRPWHVPWLNSFLMHKDTRHETFNQRIYLYCILNSMSCDIYNFPWIIFAQIFPESSITKQSPVFLIIPAFLHSPHCEKHLTAWRHMNKSVSLLYRLFSCRIIDSLFVSVQCLIINSIFQIVFTNTYCLPAVTNQDENTSDTCQEVPAECFCKQRWENDWLRIRKFLL